MKHYEDYHGRPLRPYIIDPFGSDQNDEVVMEYEWSFPMEAFFDRSYCEWKLPHDTNLKT